MKNPIKVLGPNLRGRDFVVGDLHGCFSVLMRLLESVNFDPTVDRLICVGDLVDRGPESLECLRLLREKTWFFTVLSNHEQMMLEAFTGGYMGQFWLQNGGRWGYPALGDWDELEAVQAGRRTELSNPTADTSLEIFELVELVAELPFLITINRPDGGKFHVLHAELPPGHIITDAELSSPGKVQMLATVHQGDGDSFMWSRYNFGRFQVHLNNQDKINRIAAYHFKGGTGPFSDKLSHIISGHTIMQQPLTVLGQTLIDTGAYRMHDADDTWLTMVELGEWRFYQANLTESREVQPVVINRSDISAAHQHITGTA